MTCLRLLTLVVLSLLLGCAKEAAVPARVVAEPMAVVAGRVAAQVPTLASPGTRLVRVEEPYQVILSFPVREEKGKIHLVRVVLRESVPPGCTATVESRLFSVMLKAAKSEKDRQIEDQVWSWILASSSREEPLKVHE